jgi:hypothetical protein
LNFQFIHIYSDDHTPNLDARKIACEITDFFPRIKVNVRPEFLRYWNASIKLERARISDIKKPFEKQPTHNDYNSCTAPPLVDGFVLQKLFSEAIFDAERYSNHLHIIFSNLLTCTFSEDDWRYHGRTVICGSPSIVSTVGIVEAPAKPREFYIAQSRGFTDIDGLKKQFAGKFIDYCDTRIAAAAMGCALQAIFFFITDGDPFCMNRNCRLFNSHWQQDLIRTQIEMPRLCDKHQEMANNFNRQMSMR